jgi:D-alanine-D-alanine ligase
MKKTIALVTGGFSGEAVISYKSAITIQNNMDPEKWICYLIDISSSGWFYTQPNGDKVAVDKNDFSLFISGNKIQFDAVLIGLHGTPGEDGKLQGYFDCLNIKYTSCNTATSALTFNKRYTVAVAAFGGIKVANSIHLFKNTPIAINEILSKVSLPVFVKPNNGGSSIGMSKVNFENELPQAIEKAFLKFDAIKTQTNAKSVALPDARFVAEETISETPKVCKIDGVTVVRLKKGTCNISYTLTSLENSNVYTANKSITFKK